jgi:FtsH-binding integral membrane protein
MAVNPYFLAITYAHLIGTGLISIISAKLNLVGLLNLDKQDLNSSISLLIMSIVLLYLILNQKPGIIKYSLYFAFIVSITTLIRVITNQFNSQDIYIDVLTILSSIFFGLMIVSIYDKNHDFTFIVYLSVAIISMIIARLGINITVFLESNKQTITGVRQTISIIITFILSIYIAYDTNKLKKLADKPGPPDYIQNAVSLYSFLIPKSFRPVL